MAASSGLATPFTDRINRIFPSATLAAVAEGDKLRAQGVDLVYFAAGEPHFRTPQHIKDAAIAAIQNNFTKYTAVGGVDELRDAIVARHAADFGSNYKRDEVVASVGGKHALFNTFQVLIEHGDEVIIPVPYWVSFKDMVEYCGGKCVFVETDEKKDFTLTPAMLEKAITPRTRLIIINSPNNPSGATLAPEEFTEIVRLASKRGIWVLSDECYVYLDYSGRLFSAGSIKEARERLIVVGSLSKTYSMTGWRLGYAHGPGGSGQADTEAAEPVDLQPDLVCAESRAGRRCGNRSNAWPTFAPSSSSCATRSSKACAPYPESSATCRRGRFTFFPTSAPISARVA